MSNWNPDCFIYQPDETKLLQTAMGISSRSNLDLAFPSSTSKSSVVDDLTKILESDSALDYALNELGGEISRKIEEDGLPPYSFWKIQEYAFNKLFEYSACEYAPVITKQYFFNNMRNGCNYVMIAVFNKSDDKKDWINSCISVLGYSGSTNLVTLCNPGKEDGDNIQMNFDEFWDATDSGGSLHYGILFNPKNKKFSRNYFIPNGEYREVFLNKDLPQEINQRYVDTQTISDEIESNSIPYIEAGANSSVVLDANVKSNNDKFNALVCQKINDLAGDLISKFIYRDNPTMGKTDDNS